MIITSLAAACLAIVFVESGFPMWAKDRIWGADAWQHRIKPFDCPFCLAWWIGICLSILETKQRLGIYVCEQAVLTGAIAAVLAAFIYKKLNE